MKSILAFCCALIFAAAAQAAPAQALDQSTQLLVVTTPGWSAVDGRLQLYQRSSPGNPPGNRWTAVGDPIPVVVGRNGMGWGEGVMPLPITPKAADPVKREGDGKAPAGIFRLGASFGSASIKPGNWKMPYLALTPSTDCVDDSHSRYYNQVVDRSSVIPDWASAEHMRSVGEAYRWGVVIDHNAVSRRPQGGSCVFMHIWGGAGVGTAGCTAMPEERIKFILGWLDPAAHPLLVQMPLSEYQRAEKSLHLPPPADPRP